MVEALPEQPEVNHLSLILQALNTSRRWNKDFSGLNTRVWIDRFLLGIFIDAEKSDFTYYTML